MKTYAVSTRSQSRRRINYRSRVRAARSGVDDVQESEILHNQFAEKFQRRGS